MNQPRAPRLAGVAGGVGTTTIATALRGYDRGRESERGVDVLVCRATGQSLQQAAAMLTWLAANGWPRPVLGVTADQPGPVRGTCKARLRMIEPHVAGLVVLPHVNHWGELTDPLAEAARLSEQPTEQLPKPLRGYAEALASLARLVLRSGLLNQPIGAIQTPMSRPAGTGPIQTTGPIRTTGPIQTTGPMEATGPASTEDRTGGSRSGGPPGRGFLDIPLAEFAA